MAGMHSDLRVHIMNIIINKRAHCLFIVTLKDPRNYTPRCEINSREELNSKYKKNARPEEGLNLKSECIVVSAMVHLPQE